MESPSIEKTAGPPVEPDIDAQVQSVEGELSALDDANLDMGLIQDRLIDTQLGLASSLFQTLRLRDRITADHSLRVAMYCAAWCEAREDDESLQDAIEVAALLHDIGKIGAPDSILKQPGSLSDEQQAMMLQCRINGLQILSPCCDSPEILETIAMVGAWYDGSRKEFAKKGSNLPLATRMISIADAFDSMTHDGVYRRAVTQERAINELFAYAGTQFDPKLVAEFSAFHEQGKLDLNNQVAKNWLDELTAGDTRRRWQISKPVVEVVPKTEIREVIVPQVDMASVIGELFHDQLLETVQDGVIYTDMNLNVTAWNRSAEEITGIKNAAMLDQLWRPRLVKMRDEEGRFISDKNCPFRIAIETGRKVQRSVTIRGACGKARKIDLNVEPVISGNGEVLGISAALRDATSTENLENRVEHLHKKATLDPLTGIPNRAEFDRFHKEAIERHNDSDSTCSLIICDIDHFKSINDQFGHQAGDDALISFASILQRACREGDLVARYGGEEFVMVCDGCNAADATKIAETIRKTISETGHRELDGRCITASFGVTEIQDGDSAETMLRRADRGLMQAKETGRNRVVQLGTGLACALLASPERRSWFSWGGTKSDPKLLVQTKLGTKVPMSIAIQKLQGFVSDHQGEIENTTDDSVSIRITSADVSDCRRRSDRPIPFRLQIDFEETVAEDNNKQTEMNVRLLIVNSRERRAGGGEDIARRIVRSLRSYLMAFEVQDKPEA